MANDLLEIIGGQEILRAATELFYKKVFADETLRPFFRTTDIEQLLARQRMFLAMLLGARGVYTGRDIETAHAKARIEGLNDGHFDRFLRLFRDTLTELGIEKHRVHHIVKLLESKRSSVLNP